MSLMNQPIFRKGLYVKPISNRTTYSGATLFSKVGMGSGSQSSQFANYSTDKIIVSDPGKYRIYYSFYSKGLLNFSTGAYGNFSMYAGSNIIGVLSGFTSGQENNDFGITSYYNFSSDSLTSSSIVFSASTFSWDGYFNKVVEIDLSANNEIYFNLQGTNLGVGTHGIGFNGYLFVEQIS